jgi:hypothetical protein
VLPSSKKSCKTKEEEDDASDYDGLESDVDNNAPNLNEPGSAADRNYETARNGDVIRKTRKLVKAVRGSGQRRSRLTALQQEMGEKQLQLLMDMTVRWGSTCLMVQRVLDTYSVSC